MLTARAHVSPFARVSAGAVALIEQVESSDQRSNHEWLARLTNSNH